MEALHAIATPKGGCAAGTRTRDAGLAPRRGGSRTHIAPASDCEPATRTPVLNIASGADPVEGRAQLSNGSRLSCGRRVRWRKAVERQLKRLGGEGMQFFSQGYPPASRACSTAR